MFKQLELPLFRQVSSVQAPTFASPCLKLHLDFVLAFERNQSKISSFPFARRYLRWLPTGLSIDREHPFAYWLRQLYLTHLLVVLH